MFTEKSNSQICLDPLTLEQNPERFNPRRTFKYPGSQAWAIALMSLVILMQCFIGTETYAAKNSEVTQSGDFRFRYFNNQNYLGDSRPSTLQTAEHRLRWNLDFRANQDFYTNLKLIYNGQWGQTDFKATGFGDAGDSQSSVRDGTATHENLLLVNQAFAQWLFFDATTFRIGRTSLAIGDGRVVDFNDFEKFPYSYDGLVLTHNTSLGEFRFWALKLADWSPISSGTILSGTQDPESNFYGFNFKMDSLPDILKTFNIHLIQINKDELNFTTANTDRNPSQNQFRYGLQVGGVAKNIDYRFSYSAYQGDSVLAGNQTNLSGSMVDLEVGYGLNVMSAHISVLYHTDTGDSSANDTDNSTYDALFYNKHENAGYMDIMRWGNLSYFQIKATLSPLDEIVTGIQFLKFSATNDGDVFNNGISNANNTSAFARQTGKDDLGSEIDLWVTKKYQAGLEISGRVGVYSPGGGFQKGNLGVVTGGDLESITQVYLDGRLKF